MVTAYDSGAANLDTEIARRLNDVLGRIAAAARQADRDPAGVRLVAISKFQPLDAVRAALAAGQTEFGENRAQELVAKLDEAPPGARWHFVGRLQRNKVKQVVGRVELIHSVDRVSLAEAIAAHAVRHDLCQRVLVQVDLAGEPQKGGCAPEDVPALLDRIGRLDGIAAVGLMIVPPVDAEPAPMFEQLRAMGARQSRTFPELVELSMGMSADMEAAVAHGATIVRVGTAIFGPRPRTR
jgi:hypothetical protein